MIKANAKLSIQKLPLSVIQINEFQERFPEKLLLYMDMLRKYPDQYAGLLFVVPSNLNAGMFVLMDGHHKFCASIMTGRKDALCVVIEEPEKKPGYCSKCGKYFYSAFIRDGGSGVIDVPKDGFCYGDCEKNK